MFVMDDCRTNNGYLSILLAYACLVTDGCYLDGHVLLQVPTLRSWPSYSFSLVV
jgi:hypothetical protein